MAEQTSPAVICFGDSNTYGAHGFNGGRYAPEQRWTGLLSLDPAFAGKYEFINMGENGREIPTDPWEMDYCCRKMSEAGTVRLITVMLGSNDMLMMFRSGMPKIVSRMELFLSHILAWSPEYDEAAPDSSSILIGGDPSRLMLIAPPPTQLERYGSEGALFDEMSLGFAGAYYRLAVKYGIHYANAGDWDVELGPDGVHFTEKGHRSFAAGLAQELKEIL